MFRVKARAYYVYWYHNCMMWLAKIDQTFLNKSLFLLSNDSKAIKGDLH